MTENRNDIPAQENDRELHPDCGQSQEIKPTPADKKGEPDQSRKSGYQEDQKKPGS